MTIERMNELIDKWEGQKKDYDQRMDAKISGMKKDRDLAVAAQTQKIFARHHLSPEELSKLKYASKEQLKRLLKFIDEEITESAPVEMPDIKIAKENENHAKESTT